MTIFVTLFSVTVKSRELKLGTHFKSGCMLLQVFLTVITGVLLGGLHLYRYKLLEGFPDSYWYTEHSWYPLCWIQNLVLVQESGSTND